MPDSSQQMPHNLEAEQVVIGSMLLEPVATITGLSLLEPRDFFVTHHQAIFAAIQAAGNQGPVDLITVAEELRRAGRLVGENGVGGPEYLTACINTVPTAGHVSRYAQIVAEKAVLRRLLQVGADIQNGAWQGTGTVEQAVQQLLSMQQAQSAERAQPLVDYLREGYFERVEAERRAPWTIEGPRFGIHAVDMLTGGLADEELVVVKAPEKYGKTTLLRQSAVETARWCADEDNGQAVVVYLLEGSKHQWLNGALAYLGHLHTEILRRGGAGNMHDGEEDRLTIASNLLPKLPLLLTDGLRSLDGIAADVYRLQSQGRRLAAVYVDHASLVQAPGDGHERGANVANGLLELSRGASLPVLVGSQITLQEGGARRSRFAPELEFNASSVWQIERGEIGQKNQDEARLSTKGRIRNTHRRYGEAVQPLNVWLDFKRAAIRAETERPAPVGAAEHDRW